MALLTNKKLIVSNLNYSLKFYRDIMEFKILLFDNNLKIAMVEYTSAQTVLLVENSTQDVAQWLTSPFETPQPGKHVYFKGQTKLFEYKEALSQYRECDLNWIEKEWGDFILEIKDPDGYILSFWGGKERTFDEILNYYEIAPARLKMAIEGLSEEDLDLTRAPGKWSIREIVLHIVDSDATSLAMTKFALAELGREFNSNFYSPDVWAEGLDYKSRSIETEIELFAAIRKHIAGLPQHLPNALDRFVQVSDGSIVTVKERIIQLLSHPLGHIEQILETRQVHGK